MITPVYPFSIAKLKSDIKDYNPNPNPNAYLNLLLSKAIHLRRTFQLLSFNGFDTVGWVIWPVKIVPDMTYNVFGGTLNPTLLYSLWLTDSGDITAGRRRANKKEVIQWIKVVTSRETKSFRTNVTAIAAGVFDNTAIWSTPLCQRQKMHDYRAVCLLHWMWSVCLFVFMLDATNIAPQSVMISKHEQKPSNCLTVYKRACRASII